MAQRFRKKPVEIEAMEFTGYNGGEVRDWVGHSRATLWSDSKGAWGQIIIDTLEGPMTADIGDWIIKGVEGEFYPCKPSIFAKTYEEI